jgi:hypothetical protein
MKTKVSLLLCFATVISCLHTLAAASPHVEITKWIASPVGSHLGSGYVSTYLTNIHAKTTRHEDPKLRDAINFLDGLGMTEIHGFGLVPAAVAWQAQTSLREIVAQQAETGLSYGELLVAHTLALESKHDFRDVVAMRSAAPSWGQLAEQLGVSPDRIMVSANAASSRIRLARARSNQRAPRDPSLQTTNPNLHHYYALH